MKFIISSALVLFTASAFAASTTKTTTTTTSTDGVTSVTPSTSSDKTTTTVTHSTTASTTAAKTAGTEGFSLIHVADLNAMKKTSAPVYVFDANNDKTRKTSGLIPGAKPLASVTSYDVAKTLPADKTAHVVFYCANTECMASHEAAKRAVTAGYKNVAVMSDGIQGWKKSGQPTEMYK